MREAPGEDQYVRRDMVDLTIIMLEYNGTVSTSTQVNRVKYPLKHVLLIPSNQLPRFTLKIH